MESGRQLAPGEIESGGLLTDLRQRRERIIRRFERPQSPALAVSGDNAGDWLCQPVRDGVAEPISRPRPPGGLIVPGSEGGWNVRFAIERQRVADCDEGNSQMLGERAAGGLHLIYE